MMIPHSLPPISPREQGGRRRDQEEDEDDHAWSVHDRLEATVSSNKLLRHERTTNDLAKPCLKEKEEEEDEGRFCNC